MSIRKHIKYDGHQVCYILALTCDKHLTSFVGSQGCAKCGFRLSVLVDAPSSLNMVTLLWAPSQVTHTQLQH